jgi:hypothetical protein
VLIPSYLGRGNSARKLSKISSFIVLAKPIPIRGYATGREIKLMTLSEFQSILSWLLIATNAPF